MNDYQIEQIKTPSVAGMFYPADSARLDRQIQEYLDQVKPTQDTSTVRALIVPHAGYDYSGPVAASAYRVIRGARYDRVIVVGLGHQVWFDGVALCPYAFWQTPLGKVELVKLSDQPDKLLQLNRAAFASEHSVEVQLPFLQKVMPELHVIAMLTGVIKSAVELAEIIGKELRDNDLLIISSDLSHYHPYSEAQKIDSATISQILALDNSIDHEQACGADGINMLLSIAKSKDWKPKLLDYRNSGDTAGEKNQVVGYAAVEFI